jgi:DnaJ-class molecular chaperone with C-terminal Zn finger domain
MKPHQILGIAEDASETEARMAYKRLAQLHHPDRGGDPALFRQVAAAFKQFRRKIPCSVCAGKGFVEQRSGLAVKRENCPKCWKTA